MDIFELREYCLDRLPFTEETTPFDETTLVFKVQGKMFAVCDMDNFVSVSLKCDPAYAIELRERFPEWIQPAYHFNKTHWNSVSTAGDLPDKFIRELIRHSYDLVVRGLPKSQREEVIAGYIESEIQ